MPQTVIILRKVSTYEWAMFAPKGHQLGPRYRGDKYKAKEWAKAWVSSWPGWIIEQEEELYEQENRVSK